MLTLNSSLTKISCVISQVSLIGKSIGRTVVQILKQNDCTVSPFVLNTMSKGIRKILKYLTVFDYLVFLLGTGQRSQDPALKRNGVKVPGDRRIENGVSAWCSGQYSENGGFPSFEILVQILPWKLRGYFGEISKDCCKTDTKPLRIITLDFNS